jgi:hypothetical protein
MFTQGLGIAVKVWPCCMEMSSFFFTFHGVLHLHKTIKVFVTEGIHSVFHGLRMSIILLNLPPGVPWLLACQDDATQMCLSIFFPHADWHKR